MALWTLVLFSGIILAGFGRMGLSGKMQVKKQYPAIRGFIPVYPYLFILLFMTAISFIYFLSKFCYTFIVMDSNGDKKYLKYYFIAPLAVALIVLFVGVYINRSKPDIRFSLSGGLPRELLGRNLN